ncbi:MAG: VWA domain-containing protein [Acidobacteriota bacterium]|nr:VWA domain-containing protein [Acidobacteriota bacterium]
MGKSLVKSAIGSLFVWLLLLATQALAQNPQNTKPPDQSEEVVRVYSDLVQTDVMVFNKEGRFVNGLKREDFELKIDGQVRPIEFFERVTAGSGNEEFQLSAARGSSFSTNKANPIGPVPLDRGRTILFYVDDLHLGAGSLVTTRKLITQFIEKEMGQNDEAAITSASGQIGFLQQLTDQKFVLRAALERLKAHPYSARDSNRPPMTEYQALLIDRRDPDVIAYFVEEFLKISPRIPRDLAESMVNNRAQGILNQAGPVTTHTLIGLEDLIRSSSKLPGRKLVFFISDGFLLDSRNSDNSLDRLRRITSAAARSGVVIYSMDARGLVVSLSDASTGAAFDLSGRLDRASRGELFATQDALNALARDTGGKPTFNTNALEPGLARALKETSVYYLLAWKPEHETQKTSKFRRIEVSVTNGRDLVVQVRRGFFDIEPSPPVSKQNEQKNAATPKTPEAELAQALGSPFPEHGLPLSLKLRYMNTPEKGAILSASMEVLAEFVTFGLENGKNQALIDVAVSFYDDRGKPGAKFKDRITITAPSGEGAKNYRRNIPYNSPVDSLPPGFYQVRVAARDQHSGRVGSAQAWIEVPDLKNGQLAMSSLLLGERQESAAATTPAGNQDGPTANGISVDHRFSSRSYLQFLLFVYNATIAAANAKPDLVAQVQIMRDNQPVITTPLQKIEPPTTADLARLPYAAEVPLSQLSPGLYLLQVNVIDRVSKRSTTQQTRFEVY